MTKVGKNIVEAKHLLQAGQIVAIPTETVYGLAGNALDKKAVSEIFRVKNRPHFDPLIIHTDDLDKLKNLICSIPSPLQKLAQVFMPGPLTILAPKTDRIPDLVTSGSPKVAIRIPDHPLTSDLLSELDFPLAAPSANPFGYVSPTTAQHVLDQLEGKIPYILDGGPCKIGLESTIVDFVEGEVVVLRKGGIAIEAIEKLVGTVKVASLSSSRPSAPGMLEYHYAPKIPLSLKPIKKVIEQFSKNKIGYLGWSEKTTHVPVKNQRILSTSRDQVEAAQNFFRYLRELDKINLDIIVAELVPEEGLGRAINDKLRRASNMTII